MARKKEKIYRVEISDYLSWFLPSPVRCIELLGIPTTPRAFFKYMNVQVDECLQKDALSNLTKSGVGEAIFKQINHSFKAVIPKEVFSLKLQDFRLITKSIKVQSNSGVWHSSLRGFLLARPELDGIPLIKLIESRVSADLILRNAFIEQDIEGQGAQEAFDLFIPFLFEHTLMERSLLGKYKTLLLKHDNSQSIVGLNKEDLDVMCLFNASLYADFYLSVLAHFEVNYFQDDSNSLFAEILQNSNEIKTRKYFDVWLERIKNRLGEYTEKRATWQALAKFISLEEHEGNGDNSYEERQRLQLNDWRRGDFPGKQKLQLFSEGICAVMKEWDANEIYEISKIIMALDKLRVDLGQYVRHLDKRSGEKMLDEVFEHYQHHWNYCKQKYISNQCDNLLPH